MKNATLAVRIHPDNQNHHLWNNNGTWWCHYTLHLPDFTKRRVRKSLETHTHLLQLFDRFPEKCS
jgi:hypothetical protein